MATNHGTRSSDTKHSAQGSNNEEQSPDDLTRSSYKEKGTKSRSKVDISKTRYFWVSGIPDGTKTGQLEELFLKFGKVLAIKIIRGGTDSTLLGFVKMESAEQAHKCMEKLNKTEFRGNKIELLKERPADKEGESGKKPEKIRFRDSRKPFVPRPPVRPHFRPAHPSSRGGHFRSPISKHALHSPHRDHRDHHPRVIEKDLRRQEHEELMKIERERDRIKLERMKLEREKAELLKIEREARVLERDRFHDDKRIRPISKRSVDESSYLDEKRFDEYSRRDEFSSARRFASPDRKTASNSGRSFGNRDNSRYSDSKYDSGNKWSTLSDSSSWGGNGNHSWHSNTGYESRISQLSSNIGSSTFSRLHPGSEISQAGGISSRGYFGSTRRQY